MSNPQGVSFIPKQSAGRPTRKTTVRKVYVLAYISFVFFVGSLLAAGGTWFYEYSVKNDLAAEQSALIAERQQFNQSDIERLRALDERLIEAQKLLDNHISLRSIIDALEATTIESVQLQTMNLTQDNGKINLKLQGTTNDGFNAVLYQRAITQGSSVFKEAAFGELATQEAVDEEGEPLSEEPLVNFAIDVQLNTSDVAYRASALPTTPSSDPVTEVISEAPATATETDTAGTTGNDSTETSPAPVDDTNDEPL